VLESLGISLDPVRQQVEEIIGQGQQVPVGQIPFTPRAKKVLELSLRESEQLGHDYVGTEHILLGLLREGDGVAAQVLVKLGADQSRVRRQVIVLISSRQPRPARRKPQEDAPENAAQARLDAIEGRLAAVEQRAGTAPDTTDLDEQILQVQRERHDAADAQEYEHAAVLRDREKELLASKAARQEQWTAGHPPLPALAERVQKLADETERLRALLRQHGIDPQDEPA
jgi:ATP-dependent Clp protease ATP-binding subunit ClpA